MGHDGDGVFPALRAKPAVAQKRLVEQLAIALSRPGGRACA